MNYDFSIIISVLNSEQTLQRCIDSITNQTYPFKELIIIDGGSTDRTVDILQANEYAIDYWESKKDSGIYNAWNKALDHANGDWIYFLGADDYLYSIDVLECVVDELVKIPSEYKVVYGRVCILNNDGRVLFKKGKPWNKSSKKVPYPLGIPHQGVFHHRNLFKEYGRFDESFQIAGDNDLLLRVLKTSEPYFIPGMIIAAKRYSGKSNNPANRLNILRELYRARHNNGLKVVTLIWLAEYFWALLLVFLLKTIGRKRVKGLVKLYCKLADQPPYWEKY